MKILVVYFSHRGNTARLADELAWHCGADKERIREQRSRGGGFAWWQSLWHRVFRRRVPIAAAIHDPAAYDLVVIGTPVHRGAPSLEARSYIAAHASRFKRVAFFCTNGKTRSQRALAEMQRLCGQSPVAEIVFDSDSTYATMPVAGERVRRFTSCLMAGA